MASQKVYSAYVNAMDEIIEILQEPPEERAMPTEPIELERRMPIDTMEARPEGIESTETAEHANLFEVIFDEEDKAGTRLSVDLDLRRRRGLVITISGLDGRGVFADVSMVLNQEQSLRLVRALSR